MIWKVTKSPLPFSTACIDNLILIKNFSNIKSRVYNQSLELVPRISGILEIPIVFPAVSLKYLFTVTVYRLPYRKKRPV